jgi:hypothetical protein
MRRAIARVVVAAALATCTMPVVAQANTLNAAGGVVTSGSISYTSPESVTRACGWFSPFHLVAPAVGAVVSLGGVEYSGNYTVDGTGTTYCPIAGDEEGWITSATVTGTSSLAGSSMSCGPLAGSYLRTPGGLNFSLSGSCTINGVANVGSTTFQFAGAWSPNITVSTSSPGAATSFSALTFSGAMAVTPDPSVGVGVGPPLITGITPTQGSTLGGASVEIRGVGFADGAGSRVRSITFGSATATTYTVINDNLIEVTTPAAPAGSAPVQVTTDGGSSLQTPTYTFIPPPVVTSVAPSSGGDNAAMTIYGSGFFAGGSADAVYDITLQCAACGGAVDWPYCWTTVSDSEIDIPVGCGATPGYDGFSNKTVFDVLVTTNVATSQVNAGDRWTYTKGNGSTLAGVPALPQ